jgi:thiol-disulfide isomerase/thioredoxin
MSIPFDMDKSVLEINSDQFDDLKKKSKYLLLDFYSTECPNCDKLKPVFETLNEEFCDRVVFAKIFRQNNRSLAESLYIYSSPTVILFIDGEEKFRMSGHILKHELKEKLLKISTEI